jgi:hypothetical protein
MVTDENRTPHEDSEETWSLDARHASPGPSVVYGYVVPAKALGEKPKRKSDR